MKLRAQLSAYLAWLVLAASPLAHAATVVQTATNTKATSTTLSVSLSALPTAGDGVVVVFNYTGLAIVGTLTDNQGNTYQRAIGVSTNLSTQNYTSVIWWCPSVGASTGTFTITGTVGSNFTKAQLSIIDATGIPYVESTGLAPDNFVAAATSALATNMAATTDATALVVSGSELNAAATASSPWTTLSSNVDGNVAYKINSTLDTDSITWSYASNSVQAIPIASFGVTPPAAPHIVQSMWVLSASGITSTSLPMYGVQAGNTLFEIPKAGTSTAPTVSDGTAYTQDLWVSESSGGGTGAFSLWDASAGTHTLVTTYGSSIHPLTELLEVAGLPATSSLDVTANSSGSSTGPVTATTATLANSQDFALSFSVANGYLAMLNPTNWTPLVLSSGASGNNQVSPGQGISALIPGATTALSPSFGTLASSAAWAIGVVTYKPGTFAAECTHSGLLSNGALGVPTAGVTGVLIPSTGTYVTVTCATGGPQYLQPSNGGVMGVN